MIFSASSRTSKTAVVDRRSHTRALPRALWIVMSVWLVVFAGLSVARFSGYNAGMLDLGNMAQAIGSVRRGELLMFTGAYGNYSRLAGHVELIYFAFAPLLALWPDPRVLLIAQSLLAVSGAVPVYTIARRRFDARPALFFAIGYLLFPTAVAAVLFDFHGDTLAMPLLLWMLDALDARAWRRFSVFLTLTLLCKFYLVAPVFLVGATLLIARTAPFDLADLPDRRRLGLVVCGIAVLYAIVALLVIRPAFSVPASGDTGAYLAHYFGNLAAIGWFDVLDRAVNLLAVVLPAAFLFWWSPWTALPALAIIGPAVISTGPGAAYAWSYHHYAAAVPFIIVASIDGAARRARRSPSLRLQRREAQTGAILFLGATLLFHIGLNDTPLGMRFWQSPPGAGLDASGYGRTARDELKDRWLADVPSGVGVAASNFLAPHLWDRDILYVVRYPDEPDAGRLKNNMDKVQIVIADALFDFLQQTGGGYAGGVQYDLDAIRQMLQRPDWGLTSARDGLLRFERAPAADRRLLQRIQPVSDPGVTSAMFGDGIALVDAAIEPVGERRFRATFRWRALRSFAPNEQFVAVSVLDGVPNARIVHLPSYASEPTNGWQAGQVWQEQFDVQLPSAMPAGRYQWRVGWYDTRSPFAAATDNRSRIGNVAPVMEIDLP